MILKLIEDDHQHNPKDISEFLRNFINLPQDDYLESFVEQTALSLYDFVRIAIMVKDNLFFIHEAIPKAKLTLDYCMMLATAALTLEEKDWNLNEQEIYIVASLKEAYLHNKNIENTFN